MNQLTLLPPELISLILDNLPYTDLLRCERVSKQLRKIIRESGSFQYKIELAVNGLDDVPSNLLTTAAKRDILHQHTRATQIWPEELVTKQTIPLLEGPLWELCGGVLAQSDGRRDLDFWQLPSNIRAIPAREWGVDVDFDIADFTLDPSQSLLVAVEVQEPICIVHLLSSNTGQAHKEAAVKRLSFPLPAYDIPGRSYHLRICGDYVGIIIRVFDQITDEPYTVFGVANWKTGESKLLTSFWGILSFAFLDPRHIIVLRGVDNDLEASPSEGQNTMVVVSVIDFMEPVLPNEVHEAPRCPVVSLNLPTVATRWEVWHAEVVCDPAPRCSPSNVHQSYCEGASEQDLVYPPFHITKADRIVVIRINGVDTLFEQGDAIDVFVHASSLIGLLKAHLSPHDPASPKPSHDSSPTASPPSSPCPPSILFSPHQAWASKKRSIHVTVPTLKASSYDENKRVRWDTWGVLLTRVLPATVPACVWCYPAYGMKFVGQTDGYVTIYDFNPIAVRKIRCSRGTAADKAHDAEDTYWDWVEVDGGETVTTIGSHSRQFFANTVKSGLPYRKFKTGLKMEVGQFVMLNEDSVLLVKEFSKEFKISSL
ncbi:hypothetical protein EUX98_g2634 [Antrodiella citrinella]|uniref:F-box domain-containing protein n=1 Tax=Antrodiella citrinella TaxID=2447956 RepID=A0A4S4MYH0_9APHY|nr:hypothetical protein EUX98_g2634 [Antrodiella citrinella]